MCGATGSRILWASCRRPAAAAAATAITARMPLRLATDFTFNAQEIPAQATKNVASNRILLQLVRRALLHLLAEGTAGCR